MLPAIGPVRAVPSPVTIMPLVHGPALGEKDVDTLGTVGLGSCLVSPHRMHGDSCTHCMQISLGVVSCGDDGK